MGWGKAQVSVKGLKIFDNKRDLSKLSKYYINKKLIKNSQINTLWLMNWVQSIQISINLTTAKFANSEISLIVIIIPLSDVMISIKV